MRRSSLYYITGLLVMLLIGVYSCKKVNNGIDNNQVIETPYSLYYTDSAGALYNTNDGKTVNKIVFPPDGKPTRALCVSGNNLLFAKNNLYISTNNGVNFNHSYDSLLQMSKMSCSGDSVYLNQSMLIDLPTWGDRVYSLSSAPNDASGSVDYLGLIHSDNNGVRGSWAFNGDGYDTVHVGIMPVNMTSLTQLTCGALCGIAYTPALGDYTYVRNFYKPAKGDDYPDKWKECTADPNYAILTYIYQGNTTGTPLPPDGISTTAPGFFTLGHLNNRLIAIDGTCNYGAWYSDDTGKNWTQYMGLPSNTPLLCIASPFEEVCLVGTRGQGLYTLNLTTGVFVQNNNGLGKNLVVRGIAAKENIYKNGNTQKFIYLATNQGIYQSTDGGINWTCTIPGNFVSIY